MNNDKLENRKSKLEYLKNWLLAIKQAKELVPKVQKEIEKTEWEIEALSNTPDEASEIPFGDMTILFDSDLETLEQALPMIPKFRVRAVSTSDAVSTSGTASVYEYVSRVGDIGTPNACEFSEYFTEKYQEIQLVHGRPNEIRNFLKKLPHENILDRFNRAEKIYMEFRAGVAKRTPTAMEMRTFLNGLIGELSQIAKQWEKENSPPWNVMAERLSNGGAEGADYQEMLRQERVHSSLLSRLADVGKDREGSSVTNLNHIWTELLDHVFTILTITQVNI